MRLPGQPGRRRAPPRKASQRRKLFLIKLALLPLWLPLKRVAEQAASSRNASIVSAHMGRGDHQRGHSPDGRSARGRGRRYGCRVRSAKTSGRIAQPLSGRLWST